MSDEERQARDVSGEPLRPETERRPARGRSGSRERSERSPWSLGRIGLIAWSIAVPTLLGFGVGAWIDATWPGRMWWTLFCLAVGIGLGCLHARYWIGQQRRGD